MPAAGAHAAPKSGYRPLSASEAPGLLDNTAYIPAGLGLTDSYVQDFPPQGLQVLLRFDGAFQPLMLPKRNGSPGVLITTPRLDDGEMETDVQAVRQTGLAVLRAGAVVNGGPNTPLVKKASAAIVKTLDQLTASYAKAAKG